MNATAAVTAATAASIAANAAIAAASSTATGDGTSNATPSSGNTSTADLAPTLPGPVAFRMAGQQTRPAPAPRRPASPARRVEGGLPFGGIGASAMGAYHGRAGFDAFSKQLPIVWQARRACSDFLKPP